MSTSTPTPVPPGNSSSSFRRRHQLKPIRGTRTSPHTAQVITSSGNPSLDLILGGGLAIGSICLIEEDRFMTHAKVLAKYFLAEGVVSKQEIFLGSLDDLPGDILRRLPKPLSEKEAEQEQQVFEQPAENGLRIAFRYNDLPLVNSEGSTAKIGHHFNLMEHMDAMMLYYGQATVWDDNTLPANEVDNSNSDENSTIDNITSTTVEISTANTTTSSTPSTSNPTTSSTTATGSTTTSSNTTGSISFTLNTSHVQPMNTSGFATTATTSTAPTAASEFPFFHNPRYGRLLFDIHHLVRNGIYAPGFNTARRNVCRVCLTSVGSPLWYDDHFAEDLLKFLTILRAIICNSISACFITMPMHLIAKYDANLVPKIRQLVDYAIELESFAGSERETHPAYKEYSGLLHLHKMAALNTLTVHMPETPDLAFKLRRKKFVIEKLHLPPEVQETSEFDSPVDVPNCSSGIFNPKTSMDF